MLVGDEKLDVLADMELKSDRRNDDLGARLRGGYAMGSEVPA